MPKLHLVGITPDHRGLVLSEHARAKRGDMVLEIDDRLLEAIAKAQRLRTEDEGQRLTSAALPSKRDTINGDEAAAPRLTPREIQQRLRAGETVPGLARSSGTDEAWIRRFAAPVLAEQAIVIEQARAGTFTKRGAGPSAAALGPAVAANVIDRGVALTLPDIEAAWGAYQRPEGGWHVTFTFPVRGRRQTAEWGFDPASGDLTARNKLASELGWREAGKKLPQPKPAAAPKAPAAKRSTARAASGPAPTPDPSATGATTGTGPGLTGGTTPEAGNGATPAPEEDGSRQVLPLDAAGVLPGGLVRKVAGPRRAATPKRAAAAVTEAPRQVVPVTGSPDTGDDEATGEREAVTAGTRPAGSMPPTDLDVVDVLETFSFDDDEDGDGPVIVLPPAPEDEVTAAPAAGDDDAPTGASSVPARPQPA
ncbi:MAG TPA: septation protein SepH, partial [Acidimicrobiia bacterium]|nr:septation protein SepH [Acidimicrobiia bacterium]